MADELPPLLALDKAAKVADFVDYAQVLECWRDDSAAPRSIIAHARTIAQYEQPPVDEDEEALVRILCAWDTVTFEEPADVNRNCQPFRAALAQFKRELEARK